MSEQCKRTCGTCRYFSRDPDCENIGVCWYFYIEDGEGNDCYLSVNVMMNACCKWESVASGPVGGEVVFVSSCDRDALLKVADTIEMQLNTSKSMIKHNEPEFVLKVWNDVIADSINAIRKACGVVE